MATDTREQYEVESVCRGFCNTHEVYFVVCGCDDKEKAEAANNNNAFRDGIQHDLTAYAEQQGNRTR